MSLQPKTYAMDQCVVCLTTNTASFSRIHLQSIEWQECNIQRTVEKHLWWWHMKQPSAGSLPWICRQCWQELYSFHTFYVKVEEAHKSYHVMKDAISIDSVVCSDNTMLLCVKEEYNINDSNLQYSNERLVQSENVEMREVSVIAVNDDADGIEQKRKDEIVMDEMSNCADSDSIGNNCDAFIIQEDDSSQDSQKSTNIKENSEIRKKSAKTPKPQQTTKLKNVKFLYKLEIMRKNDEYLARSNFKLFCHLCNILLKDFLKLRTHYRQEHNIGGYAICCSKKFHNRGSLADHLRVHENPDYFKCTQCNEILANRVSYENHLDVHNRYETHKRIFICEKCNKSFFKKTIYDRHILSQDCNNKVDAEDLATQHKALTHLDMYGKICDICGNSFRNRVSFMRHMQEHSDAPPTKVPCDICGVEFISKYLLNCHKKQMHTEENQQEQVCPYCPKISPNIHAHRQHINYAHTLERKHACNMCEKKFKRPVELREHLSTHTGEPLYTCAHCPWTFISGSNMHKHRKKAHPEEWKAARLKKLATQKFKDL